MSRIFGIWGFVLGGALPEQRLQVGDAEVVRLGGDDLENARSAQRRVTYLQGMRQGTQLRSSRVHVYSPWVVRWTIEADSEDEAVAAVEDDRLPRLLAALNSLPGWPYRIEIMRVGDVDPLARKFGNSRSTWGTPDGFTFGPDVRALSDRDARALSARLSFLNSDRRTWAVVRHFQDGLELIDLRARLPATMTAAAFTSFHRFIEGVIHHSYRKESITDAEISAQGEIIEDLVKRLPGRPQGKQLAYIHEASKKLNSIDNQGFLRKLNVTVASLGGGDHLVGELRDFYDFRNKYFAHHGRRITDELADGWSKRAASACQELLDLWVSQSAYPTDTASVVGLDGAPVISKGAQDYQVRLIWPSLDQLPVPRHRNAGGPLHGN